MSSAAMPWGSLYYDREVFEGRFDAEINRRQRVVTLIKSLEFIPAGWGVNWSKGEVSAIVEKFKVEMKLVVEEAWSTRYGIQWVFDNFNDRYTAKVELMFGGERYGYSGSRIVPPHSTVGLYPDRKERSNEGTLQENDNHQKVTTKRLYTDATGKKTAEYTFVSITSVHEFGHTIGLKHIAGNHVPNQDRDYGLTWDSARDVMGRGSFISERDYEPFLRIMRRYGNDHLSADQNQWKLVPAE